MGVEGGGVGDVEVAGDGDGVDGAWELAARCVGFGTVDVG